MIKPIITVLVTVALILVGTWYEQTKVMKSFSELKDTVAIYKELADDSLLTKDDAENLKKEWDDKKKYLHVFVPHSDIKEVGLWISETIAFTEYENFEEASDKLKVIYDLLEQIPENYKLKLENIL